MAKTPRPKKTRQIERREPKQARARATVEAILTATAHILERDGPDGATTNAIAERAGVSIGSVYQYFGSREALFEELTRRHVAQMQAALAQALTELLRAPLEQAIHRLMAALIAAHRINPRLDHALQRMAPISANLLDEFELLGASMAATAIRSRGDLGVDDPDRVGWLLVTAVGGVIRASLRQRPEVISDPQLERDLADLVLGFLARARAQ
jgi:AcrR family transcriptional regulator